MATTLADLENRVRRRLGLGEGSHTLTANSGNPADNDTFTINDIIFKINTTTVNNENSVTQSDTEATQIDHIVASINAVFGDATGVIATDGGSFATITGARNVEVSNTTAFTVTQTSTNDEPPLTSDIDQWLIDAQYDVLTKLPDSAFIASISDIPAVDSAVRYQEITTSGLSDELPLPADFLRMLVFSYQKNSNDIIGPAERIPADLFQQIDNADNDYNDARALYDPTNAGDRYYTIMNNTIHLPSTAPTSASVNAKVVYIQEPSSDRTDKVGLPYNTHNLLILYACSKALNSLGRAQEGMTYYQEYMQELQMMLGKYGQQFKDSHEENQFEVE